MKTSFRNCSLIYPKSRVYNMKLFTWKFVYKNLCQRSCWSKILYNTFNRSINLINRLINKSILKNCFYAQGSLGDKTRIDNLMYISMDDKQNYPIWRLKWLVEQFVPANQDLMKALNFGDQHNNLPGLVVSTSLRWL